MITNCVQWFSAVLLIATASLASAKGITTYGECTTPDGDYAFCIDLEQCEYLYNIVLNPPLKEKDRSFLTRSQCGANNGKVLICCRPEHFAKQEPQVTIPGLIPEPGVCGKVLSNRIYGGKRAKIEEFPWMALIMFKTSLGLQDRCAGSLINDRYVLTAAHCIKSSYIPASWTISNVRLGEWNKTSERDCELDTRGIGECSDPYVDVPVESVITHQNYVHTSGNQLHDIALLRLSRSVNFTDFIQPICLPVADHLNYVSLIDVRMDIAGWGLTENGTSSPVKLKAVVPGLPLSACQVLYATRGAEIASTQICAGGERGVDSCCGDSGGALVALDASNKLRTYFYIAGVISFGPTPCGLHGWPGVYTKVTSYMDWILQNIQP